MERLTDALRSKLGRYVVAGGLAALIDLGVFLLLDARGAPTLAAAAGSFIVAAVANYVFCALYVFSSSLQARRFVLFLAMAACGLAINAGVTTLAADAVGLAPALAKIGGIGVAFVFNFSVNALLVFPAGAAAGDEAPGPDP